MTAGERATVANAAMFWTTFAKDGTFDPVRQWPPFMTSREKGGTTFLIGPGQRQDAHTHHAFCTHHAFRGRFMHLELPAAIVYTLIFGLPCALLYYGALLCACGCGSVLTCGSAFVNNVDADRWCDRGRGRLERGPI